MNEEYMQADWDNTAIVIPVYNAGDTLSELLWGVLAFVPADQVICVDDASTDDSVEICLDHGVLVHRMPRNRGKGCALKTGFNLAMRKGFEFALTMDSDMQHHPMQMEKFLAAQRATGADMVIGRRDFFRGGMPPARICSNTLTSLIVTLSAGTRICDSQSGYRLYRLETLKGSVLVTERYQFETEVIFEYVRNGGRIVHTGIDTIYNEQISHIRHLRDMLNFQGVILYEISRSRSISGSR